MATPENDGFIRSFARGLSVIETMGNGTGSHTVASVAAATQLPRTVVRRILLTLTQLGFTAVDGKGFRLTPKILNLSMTYLTSLPFWGVAQGVLEQLCVELKESAALSVFDGQDVVYLMRVPSTKVTSLRLGVGSHVPAYNTSPGRVFLAWQEPVATQRYLEAVELRPYTRRTVTNPPELLASLASVRDKGFAWVDGEFDALFSGLAVPVRDAQGQIAAALSINLVSGDTTEARAVKRLLPPLQDAAERLRSIAPSFLGAAARSTSRQAALEHN
jgi:IclR family pca regulon transcriptional regulator